jgi:hypothetical protein
MQRYDSTLHTVVTGTGTLAEAQAAAAQQSLTESRPDSTNSGSSGGATHSLLTGVPYGLKDLFAAPGYPTSWGLSALRNRTIDTVRHAVLCSAVFSGCDCVHQSPRQLPTGTPMHAAAGCHMLDGLLSTIARLLMCGPSLPPVAPLLCCVSVCPHSLPGRTVPCLALLVLCCWPRQPQGSWHGVTSGLMMSRPGTLGMLTQGVAGAAQGQQQEWRQVGARQQLALPVPTAATGVDALLHSPQGSPCERFAATLRSRCHKV